MRRRHEAEAQENKQEQSRRNQEFERLIADARKRSADAEVWRHNLTSLWMC